MEGNRVRDGRRGGKGRGSKEEERGRADKEEEEGGEVTGNNGAEKAMGGGAQGQGGREPEVRGGVAARAVSEGSAHGHLDISEMMDVPPNLQAVLRAGQARPGQQGTSGPMTHSVPDPCYQWHRWQQNLLPQLSSHSGSGSA